MSNLNSLHVQMQVECPECREKILLHVGLEPDTANNSVECPNCHHTMVPLVPGPIVGGPFSVDA
jgi:DNA-directed RNA polymerase subunit RPC12/RpoP